MQHRGKDNAKARPMIKQEVVEPRTSCRRAMLRNQNSSSIFIERSKVYEHVIEHCKGAAKWANILMNMFLRLLK